MSNECNKQSNNAGNALRVMPMLSGNFFAATCGAPSINLFRPVDGVFVNDELAERYLTEFDAAFGGVPQCWHTVFARTLESLPEESDIDLPLARWGYLDAAGEKVPVPFAPKARTVKHPMHGTEMTMTPDQFALFCGAVVFNVLAGVVVRNPRFLARAMIRGVDAAKCSAWYRACNTAIHAFAENDESWAAVMWQLD